MLMLLSYLQDLFTRLQKFVASHYPTGLKWNPAGISSIDALTAVTADSPTGPVIAAQSSQGPAAQGPAAAAAPRGPPVAPPPPPGLKDMLMKARPAATAAVSNGNSSSGGPGGSGMSDVLAALKQVRPCSRIHGTPWLGAGCSLHANVRPGSPLLSNRCRLVCQKHTVLCHKLPLLP